MPRCRRYFREFLRINQKGSGLFYNHFKSQQASEQKKEESAGEHAEFDKEYPPDVKVEQAHQAARNTLYAIEEICAERMQRIAIPTKDQLGIVYQSLPSTEQKKGAEAEAAVKVDQLVDFWEKATCGEKLTLFRDFTMSTDILDDPKWRQAVLDELNRMGLTDEANRLKHMRYKKTTPQSGESNGSVLGSTIDGLAQGIFQDMCILHGRLDLGVSELCLQLMRVGIQSQKLSGEAMA